MRRITGLGCPNPPCILRPPHSVRNRIDRGRSYRKCSMTAAGKLAAIAARSVSGTGRSEAEGADRLIREWQGAEHCATVLDDAFEYQGRRYRSLSAIARAITGTRWNGPAFFGLRNHRSGK
jgi:hypothetical protein